MAKEPAWVLDEMVFYVHQMLLSEHGGETGIRDRALLESALARPGQRFGYEPETAIIFEQLAAGSISEAELSMWFEKNSMPSAEHQVS